MKLYLLKRTDSHDYDEMIGAVVVASNEAEARQIAGSASRDEGSVPWAYPGTSTCVELTAEGPARLVLAEGIDG